MLIFEDLEILLQKINSCKQWLNINLGDKLMLFVFLTHPSTTKTQLKRWNHEVSEYDLSEWRRVYITIRTTIKSDYIEK